MCTTIENRAKNSRYFIHNENINVRKDNREIGAISKIEKCM